MRSNSNRVNDGGLVNLVVAHSWEARPLIEQFKLNKQSSQSFKVYGGDQGVSLIVSGMGKIAAAAAVAYLAASQESARQCASAWLNIGIAGHQTEAVGSLLLAGKISDAASGQSIYPALQGIQWPAGAKVGELLTVDVPELTYPENKLYEMEAFGFYTSANKFVTAELIQVVKIVSDNPGSSVDNINAKTVAQWISSHSNPLKALVSKLQALAADYNDAYSFPEEYELLRASASFSATQEAQLRRLYRRYYALGMSELADKLKTDPSLTSKQILAELDRLVGTVKS